MTRICSWCGKFISLMKPLDDHSITHTVCKKCKKRILKQHKEIEDAKKKFIESLR